MLYVIAIVNLLVGIITFAYLFAEPKPEVDYLFAAMLGSIVLNILLVVLIRKNGKNYSYRAKLFSSLLLSLGDFELWFPILSTPHIMDLLWH
ncbi:MAG: hypothetical protein J6T28_02585 [Paludibacteraceae bacterium]|nr:hypothetical protein [Paludibacteraceae bacterium]